MPWCDHANSFDLYSKLKELFTEIRIIIPYNFAYKAQNLNWYFDEPFFISKEVEPPSFYFEWNPFLQNRRNEITMPKAFEELISTTAQKTY